METQDTLEHIRRVNEMRPYMEEYNRGLIKLFEDFLNDPTYDNIMKVYDWKQDRVSGSSHNSYKNIRLIHMITDIAVREISIGYVPITEKTLTCREAMDKYRKTVFMMRRFALMNDKDDDERLSEAIGYLMDNRISPVAIHSIINSDIGFGDMNSFVMLFAQLLRESGREKDAVLLERM